MQHLTIHKTPNCFVLIFMHQGVLLQTHVTDEETKAPWEEVQS